MDIKKQISKITANPIGLLAGAGLGFMAAKKFSKTGNKYVLIGATVAGGLFGALAQAFYKAKKGAVTVSTVKK